MWEVLASVNCRTQFTRWLLGIFLPGRFHVHNDWQKKEIQRLTWFQVSPSWLLIRWIEFPLLIGKQNSFILFFVFYPGRLYLGWRGRFIFLSFDCFLKNLLYIGSSGLPLCAERERVFKTTFKCEQSFESSILKYTSLLICLLTLE